ncbi:hypothetical protein HanPI659440_Chr06g0248251 [Helianthus annuus]|uniref:Lipoprotein n=1 Tax=Helianthus annuus TaxID=4232 RepID=A0A251UMC9_HELAN|nr:hypothetical protein HanPI659440_Chr06g0248251 [Helianthus annuus]
MLKLGKYGGGWWLSGCSVIRYAGIGGDGVIWRWCCLWMFTVMAAGCSEVNDD